MRYCILSPDFINHDPALPTPDADLQTLKQLINQHLAVVSAHSTEEDMIVEGDKVVVCRTFQGTHDGEYMGIAPIGNKITYTGIFIARLHDGKIAEQWVSFDALSVMQQIGAISMPE